MQLNHGTLLQGGRYAIESVLGQGSFGITYLATTKFQGPLGAISVKVAIKEFFARDLNLRHPDGTVAEVSSGSLSGKYAKDFQREAKNLSSLKHPDIINVLEAFSENNTHYYVMEYLDGGNLDDYIQSKGRLSESEALDIASQMASALSYMHFHNMLHLDLKPRNVMRRSDGTVCLIDFGLSKQYESNGEPESSTTIGLGTPGYAPLEQGSSDERKNFAPTLDIYALGASIFKMLTGKTPPRASDIMNDGFPSEDLEALGVSPETIARVERMMSPKKKDRPQTVAECGLMAADRSTPKEKVSCTEDTELLKEEAKEETTVIRERRGNGLLWGVLSCVVAAVLGVFLYVWLSGPGARRDDDLLEIRESEELPESIEDVFVEVVSEDDDLQDMQQNADQQSAAAAEAERKRVEAENARIAAEKAEQERKRAAAAEAERKRQVEAERKRNEIAYRDGVLYVKGVEYPMVYVSGGTFRMGSDDSDAFPDEKPVHSVTLSSYRMGKYEVTQDIWEAVMGSNPSYFKGLRKPVENVSWEDCQTFIRKLNDLTGKHFRLPAEAEWEFAARGGNSSRGCKYSGSSTVGYVAWYKENSGKSTHDVGTKSPNELGIYDMSGNVWEWCQDWYGSYDSSSQTNPRGPASGSSRVYRGGSWYNSAEYCRVSNCLHFTPGHRISNLGFRLCL